MSSINKPKKILSISDIHIFRNKRHQEHREVIDNLCKIIKEKEIELVYIGGDVVDSKSRLSPEQISVTSYLFLSIASLAPIVMIPGNHDIDLKKSGALDSLTPIIDNLDTKYPIFYLKETGVYNLYDMDWAVWSCIDNLTPVIDKKNYTIGCYHGPIKGCQTESGFTFPNAPSEEIFNDCDIAILGDIHYTSYFRNREIVMNGSLVQVNIDESTERGGILWEWNGSKYEPTFVKVPNQYGFKTFVIEDLNSFDEKTIILPTEKFVCRLLYVGEQKDYSTTAFQEIRKKVKSLFPKNEIVLQKRFKKNKNVAKAIEQNSVSKSKDWFNEFFLEKETPQPVIDLLREMDIKYDKSIDISDYQTGEYFIEELQIENFLAYGKDNIIDFKSIEGIDGLFAANRVGKSSVLYAIMFCLFNKASKTNGSLAKLINDQMPEGTAAFVQLKLIINGTPWRIKRTITPSKKNVSINVEVYETVDDVEIARHEESRPKTDAGILRKLLGDEESFLTLVLFNGNSANEFANNKNSNRLDLILKFLGISIFDKKLELVDEDLKAANVEHKLLVKEFEKLTIQEDLEDLIEDQEELIELKLKELANTKVCLQEEKERLAELKQTHKALDIIKLDTTLENVEKNILTVTSSIAKLEGTLTTLRAAQNDLEAEIDSRVEDVEALEQSLLSDEEVDTYKEINFEYKSLVKKLKKQLDEKICFNCGKPSEIDEVAINEQLIELEKQIGANDLVLEAYSLNKQAIADYHKLLALRQTKGQSIEIQEKDLLNLKQKLELFDQQKTVLNNNKEKIDLQESLEVQVEECEDFIKNLERTIGSTESQIEFCKKQIGSYKLSIDNYKKKKEEIVKSEENINLYTLYKQGMHRTGIPASILQQQIPLINQTLSNYTEDLFDFKIEFCYNDESLDIEFMYASQKNVRRDVTQASGMEGTAINLVIRAALSEVSLLPKPSLLMLDEVFNTLDDVNLEKMKECLKRLKDNYQNIVVISHLEDIKDLPEHYILLERDNNITSVKTS